MILSIRTLSILLFLSFVTLMWVFAFMSWSNADFVDSMVPELIGFCLEGIFFIGLFSLWQARKEKLQKQRLSRSLRGFLGIFLREMNSGIRCSDFKPIENPEELSYSCSGINRLIDSVNHCSINETVISSLHQLSRNELSSLENLLPVAAQLSADHMTCWNRILSHVKVLGQTQCQDKVMQTLVQLLNDIKHFDSQVI